MSREIHAIALFSGGLDSMIACRLVADLGIKVTAIYYDIGFGVSNEKRAWLEQCAKMSHCELIIKDITEQYVQDILFNPKYGYGKAFNPCIDCHANMFTQAEKERIRLGADFIISGEVLGERPFSQNRNALNSVANHSGVKDKILRPLSAKLLPPTQMELDGLVDREKLLDICGRSRKIQLELAKKYNFSQFESPAGGCLYTDLGFSVRLKEQIEFRKPLPSEIKLLKIGRHLRLPDGAKLIIGRNEMENEHITCESWTNYDNIQLPLDLIGASGLLEKTASESDRYLACKIIISYSKAKPDTIYSVNIGINSFDVKYSDKSNFSEFII